MCFLSGWHNQSFCKCVIFIYDKVKLPSKTSDYLLPVSIKSPEFYIYTPENSFIPECLHVDNINATIQLLWNEFSNKVIKGHVSEYIIILLGNSNLLPR